MTLNARRREMEYQGGGCMKRYRIDRARQRRRRRCSGSRVRLARRRRSRQQAASMDKVTLQLKWVPQAQFAGYYAAAAKGYYKQFGLDVTLKPGGPGHHAGAGRGVGSGAVRPRLAAVAARHARQGRRPRQHRPGLHALRHDGADVEAERDQHDQEDDGQEGRRLVLRQRERALRGAREERDQPEELVERQRSSTSRST